MKSRLCLLLITVSLLFCFRTNGQSIIAQVASINPSANITCGNTDTPFTINVTIGQTFKSLVTTTLLSVQFGVFNIISSGTINLEVYSCSSPTSWGSLLGTISNVAVNSAGAVVVDFSSLSIPVTVNNYYGFRVVPNFGFLANLDVANEVYTDGSDWLSSVGFSSDNLTFTVTGNAALPVQLTSFTVQKQNNKALLQWSTASEQNAKEFNIQRSTDGNRWNNIGTVAAHGNSNTVINYSYTDNDPVTGTNYYRLQETDIDGKATFSEIRTVKFTNEGNLFSIIANPVSNGELKLQVNETTLFSLYDLSGRLLWKNQLTEGIQTINVGNYSKGIYLLKAKTTTKKIMLQ